MHLVVSPAFASFLGFLKCLWKGHLKLFTEDDVIEIAVPCALSVMLCVDMKWYLGEAIIVI